MERSIELERKVSFVFKLIFFGYLYSQALADFHRSFIISIFLWSGLCVGGCAILLRLLNRNRFTLVKSKYWVLFFEISYMISILCNIRYGVRANLIHFIIFTLVILLLFVRDKEKSIQQSIRQVNIFANMHIVFMDICIIISLVELYLGYGKIEEIDGYFIKSGFVENRLWGVFLDPNHAAIFAIIALVVCCYQIFLNKDIGKLFKAFYIISALLQVVYMAFSDSRTASLALACVGGFVTFCLIVNWKEKVKPKQVIKGIMLGSVVGIISFLVPMAVQKGYNYSVEIVDNYSQSQVKEAPQISESREIYRPYEMEADISNQRFDIWKSGVEVFLSKPIVGVTSLNLRTYAKEVLPDTYIMQEGKSFSHFHNEFLNVLVAQGIIGFVAFIGLVIQQMYYLLTGFVKLKNGNYQIAVFSLAIILAIFVEMFFQQSFVYVYSPTVFIFWITLGFLNELIEKDVR